MLDPSSEIFHTIHGLKRNLIELRKTIWLLREVISTLYKEDSHLIKIIKKKTLIYFRDVYDHTIQVIDKVETLSGIADVILDVYLSSVSNRMNEVIKVLTIIATIFIPLTFIARIYGMNFKYMSDLELKYGYTLVLVLMLIIGIGMLIYFGRKNSYEKLLMPALYGKNKKRLP